jgi:hypothetical protein
MVGTASCRARRLASRAGLPQEARDVLIPRPRGSGPASRPARSRVSDRATAVQHAPDRVSHPVTVVLRVPDDESDPARVVLQAV